MTVQTPAELPCIQGLWVGGALSRMEQLSIKSFLAQGHRYRLYTYGDVKHVPEGTDLKDANEILPASSIFRCDNGSYSGFSNIFRYKLLLEKGGWWVDLDVVCIKAFDFKDEYVLASENQVRGQPKICAGILKVPKGCDFIRRCYEAASKIDTRNVAFGQTGFELFIPLANDFHLTPYVQPPKIFCPLNWWETKRFTQKQIFLSPRFKISPKSHAVHLWNEMWRRENLDKDALYDKKTLYGWLQHKYCD